MRELVSADTVSLINTEQLDSLYLNKKKFILLDARSSAEFRVSHLSEAKWIGEGEDLPALNLSDTVPVVIYCSIGYRSGKVGERLLQKGHNEVYNLDGGVFHWVNAQRKLVKTQGVETDTVHGYSPLWGMWIKEGTVVYE